MSTVPMAQHNAAITPRNLLNRLVCMFHGSMISSRPVSVLAAASHCVPRMRSPRIGQASSNVQIGMVKISTAVLPGPPSTSAQVDNAMKPVIWNKPIASVAPGAISLSGLPISLSAANKASAPPKLRSAAKAKGGA